MNEKTFADIKGCIPLSRILSQTSEKNEENKTKKIRRSHAKYK